MAGALGVFKTGAQTLTNGFDQPGILALGTTNVYTFYATNGNAVLLRVGAPTFRPLLRLLAPNGTQAGLASGASSGSLDAYLETMVLTNGIFSVAVSSYYGTGSGSYAITQARIPDTFVKAPGDEGGILINGSANTGVTSLGDMDVWTFNANTGDAIIARMGG